MVDLVADCAAATSHGQRTSHRSECLVTVMHTGCDCCMHSMEPPMSQNTDCTWSGVHRPYWKIPVGHSAKEFRCAVGDRALYKAC
jgi:hypothetical protein